jgi:ABC-type lipoprotein release transport system permease subunit
MNEETGSPLRVHFVQLPNVSPFDPTIFAAVAAALLCAGLAATFLPARRATRVAPVVAFRTE